jgi:hypothetical protein
MSSANLSTVDGKSWAGVTKREGLGLSMSLRLDVEGPDHFAPLLGLGGDELPEFGRRP